jgi:hypothetical protein
MEVTVTVAPRTCVSKGSSRCSSNMVNQPVACSDSPQASTVASSISSSSLALLSRVGFGGPALFAGAFGFMIVLPWSSADRQVREGSDQKANATRGTWTLIASPVRRPDDLRVGSSQSARASGGGPARKIGWRANDSSLRTFERFQPTTAPVVTPTMYATRTASAEGPGMAHSSQLAGCFPVVAKGANPAAAIPR